MMLAMDPYYTIDIEGQQRIRGLKCKSGGTNPSWKAADFKVTSHTMQIDDLPATSRIYVRFYSEDDKLIGIQTVRVSDLINTGGDLVWYDLTYEEKSAGRFLMRVTYQGPDSSQAAPQMGVGSAQNQKVA